jgi:hypothetical protein
MHAVSLSRTGALDAELAGVDAGSKLWRYTHRQLWIVVPLLLVVQAISQLPRRPSTLRDSRLQSLDREADNEPDDHQSADLLHPLAGSEPGRPG